MRRWARVFVLATLVFEYHDTRAEPEMMSYVGKTIVITYESGLEIKARYDSETEMTWRALSGPEEGREGTETIRATRVAPEVFFISWLEAKGTSVSNVLNFRSRTAFAFVTFEVDGSRMSSFEKGTFREIAD